MLSENSKCQPGLHRTCGYWKETSEKWWKGLLWKIAATVRVAIQILFPSKHLWLFLSLFQEKAEGSGAASAVALLAEIEIWPPHSTWHLPGCSWRTCPVLVSTIQKKKQTDWTEDKGGLRRWSRGWKTCLMRSFLPLEGSDGCKKYRGSLFTRSHVQKTRGKGTSCITGDFILIQEQNFLQWE